MQGEGLMILIYTLNLCTSTVLLSQTHANRHKEVWLRVFGFFFW